MSNSTAKPFAMGLLFFSPLSLLTKSIFKRKSLKTDALEEDVPSIAIIGGGASGTITAIHLLKKLQGKAKIYLIEKRKTGLFRGAAYSSQLNYEPLNVVTARMSVYNDQPDDFYNWVKENRQQESKEEITHDSFVSRRWYGDYLTDRITEAKKNSKHASFEVIHAGVLDISNQRDGYTLNLSNDSQLVVNHLVFATGNEAPADIFDENKVAALGNKYISNPWNGNNISKLDSDKDILIIGTGLTAVDFIISLNQQGHRGTIYAFSRHGFFPLVHSAHGHYTFSKTGEEREVDDVLQVIKANVKQGEEKGIDWQNVMDGLRPNTTAFWKKMSVASKRIFMNRLRVFWEIHRHRMPQRSADILGQMIETGKLKVLAGNFKRFDTIAEQIQFVYRDKRTGGELGLPVGMLLNCTGPTGNFWQTGNTLIKNLLRKGWMKQDELKLGIVTGEKGEIIKLSGSPLDNAYAVGPLRKATEWESTAIREIRTQAEEVAQLTAQKLKSKIQF